MNPVARQYDRYPYPRIPLLAKAQIKNSFPLNYEAAMSAAYGNLRFISQRARILVVGCGSFEACIVAQANPGAEIVAIDFSVASLRRLRWHLLRHNLFHRVKIIQADFLQEVPKLQKFDYVIATGVLHHLPNPELGLEVLSKALTEHGVLRAMLYSKHGREYIYRLQNITKKLHLDSPRKIKRFIHKLPSDHPMKVNFHLYQDSKNNAGIVDGFLHVQDTAFDALDCAQMLERQNLYTSRFFHPVGGNPEDVEQIVGKQNRNLWENIAFLDRLGELESNFTFFCVPKAVEQDIEQSHELILNPVLRNVLQNPFTGKAVYSRLLRKKIVIPKSFLGAEIYKEIFEQMDTQEISDYLLALILLRK